MPKYIVRASWEVCGEVEVEADSLEEAIEMVESDNGEVYHLEDFKHEYIDGSFKVSHDCSFKKSEIDVRSPQSEA